MFGAPLFLAPPRLSPSNDPGVQLEQAKFWSIPIALYTGMRLDEISMLYQSDFFPSFWPRCGPGGSPRQSDGAPTN